MCAPRRRWSHRSLCRASADTTRARSICAQAACQTSRGSRCACGEGRGSTFGPDRSQSAADARASGCPGRPLNRTAASGIRHGLAREDSPEEDVKPLPGSRRGSSQSYGAVSLASPPTTVHLDTGTYALRQEAQASQDRHAQAEEAASQEPPQEEGPLGSRPARPRPPSRRPGRSTGWDGLVLFRPAEPPAAGAARRVS